MSTRVQMVTPLVLRAASYTPPHLLAVTAPARIVVLLHHGLGDLLMAVPLLRALDGRPGAELVVVVRSALEVDVLEAVGLTRLREIVAFSAYSGRGARGFASLSARLRRWRADYFLAAHSVSEPRQAMFAWSTGARLRVGPEGARAPFYHRSVAHRTGEHKSNYYLRFAERAGLYDGPKPSGLLVGTDAARQVAARRLAALGVEPNYVILAPGSGEAEAHKRWPVASYAAFAHRFVARHADHDVVCMGAPAELALVKEIVQAAERGGTRIVPLTDLPVAEALEVYRQAACVVAGCNGATHIAAAADAPIVGLYGPTNPGYTGPNSTRLRTIRVGYACSPCYRSDFIHGCGAPVCMSAIGPEPVLAAVEACLQGLPFPPPAWVPTTNARRADLRIIDRPVDVPSFAGVTEVDR